MIYEGLNILIFFPMEGKTGADELFGFITFLHKAGVAGCQV